ncbi:PLP-dependent aminotransferase family protein [Providencia rettgeri]|uniref:MocR-like pyridoxine biosynthesis transcription factor PdxR n=1 Tax=Providencia rettgeri TaxID=587 RepID=UPI0034E07779
MFLKIDTNINTPIYLQIYQRIHDGIKSGQLTAEQRLPSVRVLASELNVARGTIELAYQLLVSEGVLETKGAKGTFIAETIKNYPANGVKTCQEQKNTLIHKKAPPQLQQTHDCSVLRVNDHSVSPFQLGIPALDAFPHKLWARLSAKILRDNHFDLLDYPSAQGVYSLREGLARYLVVSRGIDCTPEQIFICFGHRASLQLIAQSLFTAGDVGWFEEPGYHFARDFLQQIGLKLIPVNVDEQGINVEQGIEIAPEVKFALVTPTHQSPMNVTLTLARRLALLEWANERGSWIIEDDYDGEFHYQGRPLPALKSLDTQERVIYCGTFSKVLYPALRLSYIVVPSSYCDHFYSTAKVIGNQCPSWQQEITSLFIQEGHFPRHLRKMRQLYRQRRAFLIEAIKIKLNQVFEVQLQAGGMHIIVKIINGIPASQFIQLAKHNGIKIESLSDWSINKKENDYLLLGFTNIKDKHEALILCEKLNIITQQLLL